MKHINLLTLMALILYTIAILAFFWANIPLFTFLGLHIIACIMGIAHFNKITRPTYKRRYNLLLLYFALLFFIPLLGFIGALLLNEWLTRTMKHFNPHLIKTMTIRQVQTALTSRFSIGGLYYHLKHQGFSHDEKLNVLHEAMNIAPQKINTIIRTLLTDNNDEVRLLSFQLLNAQEEKIVHAINTSLKKLRVEKTNEKKFYFEKELAFEHWEFLYQGLTESTLAPLIREKAYTYTLTALQQQPDDTALLYLAGRLSFINKDYESTNAFFKRYIAAGGLPERLTSYEVEMAYHERNFSKIRDILSHSSPKSNIYISYAFYQFWNPAHA